MRIGAKVRQSHVASLGSVPLTRREGKTIRVIIPRPCGDRDKALSRYYGSEAKSAIFGFGTVG